MNKKIVICCVGVFLILVLAGVTPIALSQGTEKTVKKTKGTAAIENQRCSICPFIHLNNEGLMDQFNDDEESCYDLCSEVYINCLRNDGLNCIFWAWFVMYPFCIIFGLGNPYLNH